MGQGIGRVYHQVERWCGRVRVKVVVPDCALHRQRKLPVARQGAADQRMIDAEHGPLGVERAAVVQCAVGQHVLVLVGKTGGQHQRPDVVQQAGGKCAVRVDLELAREQLGAYAGGKRVAPEGLETEVAARRLGKAAGQRAGRHQRADAAKAQHGNGLRNADHLRLQAVKRGIGQAQRLGGERLVECDLGAEQVDVDVLLFHGREQFDHHRRQRRQVADVLDDFFDGDQHGEWVRR